MSDFSNLRLDMVTNQVEARGVRDERVLEAMRKVPREAFIPVGSDSRVQELVRVTRVSEDEFEQEDLADVRFVPLVGDEGWAEQASPSRRERTSTSWLTVFVGANLFQQAFTGFCPAAIVLRKLFGLMTERQLATR